jgi:hypothetical protein
MAAEARARRQAITVTVVAALTYVLSDYHTPFRSSAWSQFLMRLGASPGQLAVLHNHTWDGVLFFLVIPLLAVMALRANPLHWGLGLGRWRWTLGLTLVGAAGAALLLYVAVRLPVFQRYYRPLGPQDGLWPWIALFAIDMLAWEYYFRSFMLFGLEPALGDLAIYVQMIPFALAHLGKPEIETLASIFGGILIGYVVRWCRSFWPAFVLHLIIALVMYTL